MSTTQQDTRVRSDSAASSIEERSFRDVLGSWLGKAVTIVSPESFEDAPIGRQLRTGFYRARLVGLGNDYVVLGTQYAHTGPHPSKEPVRQYVPLRMIKRISALKTERVIHL